jgi:hypothetical protein
VNIVKIPVMIAVQELTIMTAKMIFDDQDVDIEFNENTLTVEHIREQAREKFDIAPSLTIVVNARNDEHKERQENVQNDHLRLWYTSETLTQVIFEIVTQRTIVQRHVPPVMFNLNVFGQKVIVELEGCSTAQDIKEALKDKFEILRQMEFKVMYTTNSALEDRHLRALQRRSSGALPTLHVAE